MRHEDIRLDGGLQISEKTAFMTEHDKHSHDTLEISIVLHNVIKYHLVEKDVFGQPGDVFLYRPFEPHFTLVEDATQPAEWIMVLFSPSIVSSLPLGHHLLAPFYAAHLSPHMPSDSPFAPLIHQAAIQAVKEQKERKPGWEAKRLIHVYDILIYIYRHYMEENADDSADLADVPDIVHVIQYMMNHRQDKLDVNNLIPLTTLRKTRFYQRFRAITGLTPSQFMNRFRLQSAIHRLNHTNMTITEIAYDCGFGTISYFNRCFKEYMGISPREHRRRIARKQGARD